MKTRTFLRWWSSALLFMGATFSLHAAFTVGGTAYTKRFETNLLGEPSALAKPAAKLAFGLPVKVLEVRGLWLRVDSAGQTGWIFNGNLSEIKPSESKGLDGIAIAASKTTATAAARPLTPAAEDYATRQNLTTARDDLNWLLAESAKITPDALTVFLQAQKKGEFQ